MSAISPRWPLCRLDNIYEASAFLAAPQKTGWNGEVVRVLAGLFLAAHSSCSRSTRKAMEIGPPSELRMPAMNFYDQTQELVRSINDELSESLHAIWSTIVHQMSGIYCAAKGRSDSIGMSESFTSSCQGSVEEQRVNHLWRRSQLLADERLWSVVYGPKFRPS